MLSGRTTRERVSEKTEQENMRSVSYIRPREKDGKRWGQRERRREG